MMTVTIKNKTNQTVKTHTNVKDVEQNSNGITLAFDNHYLWYSTDDYTYHIMPEQNTPMDDGQPDYKSAYNDHIAIIKKLENENAELRNTIVGMCKSAFGG